MLKSDWWCALHVYEGKVSTCTLKGVWRTDIEDGRGEEPDLCLTAWFNFRDL